MLMMMASQNVNKDRVTLTIESFDGQRKNLQFDNVDNLQLFLDTDFEVIKVTAPDKDLVKIRSLLKEQRIMDVSRNAIINIDRKIKENFSDDRGRQSGDDTQNQPKVYDFNIHEKDIRVI